MAPLKRADDGISLLRQAWSRRTENHTDFGPARNHAAIVIQLDLTLVCYVLESVDIGPQFTF